MHVLGAWEEAARTRREPTCIQIYRLVSLNALICLISSYLHHSSVPPSVSLTVELCRLLLLPYLFPQILSHRRLRGAKVRGAH